jgi:hypothetical protein
MLFDTMNTGSQCLKQGPVEAGVSFRFGEMRFSNL